MNIKDQVLSIEQVRELQELGFDVEKNASMCWVKLFDHDNFYRILNKEYAEYAELNDYIPTMSIGDIIEVLPENIDNNFFLMFEKDYVAYNNRYLVLMSKEKKNLITALFETLKWSIKEKHIEL